MTRILLFILLSSLLLDLTAQGIWQVTELADMPEPVSNNAVATYGNYVYSFMGIDSTKLYSGIHLKGFRYDIANNSWDTIPPVPDNLSRIAASASQVNGKIYIVGGYHVYSNQSEVSSDKLFVYDPVSNSFSSGADVPIATDDHIQCVWNDSLIYVISGWSNPGQNITDVQIYNPALDTWSVGVSVPAGSDYKAFGASGVIVNNSIYYAGGVSDGWGFPIISKMRFGTIDPIDPTQITWTVLDDSLAALYRSGAAVVNDQPTWLGGADTPYNYNGLAYGTNLGVEPLDGVTWYDPLNQSLNIDAAAISPIMDLRGLANIDSNKFIIAGGMGPGQKVSNKTYLLEYTAADGVRNEQPSSENALFIFPNPVKYKISLGDNSNDRLLRWEIIDVLGRSIDKGQEFPKEGLSIHSLDKGLYSLKLFTGEEVLLGKFVVTR